MCIDCVVVALLWVHNVCKHMRKIEITVALVTVVPQLCYIVTMHVFSIVNKFEYIDTQGIV